VAIGPWRSWAVFYNRIKSKKNLDNTKPCDWDFLVKNYSIDHSFELFFATLQQKSLSYIPDFYAGHIADNIILKDAQAWAENRFALLGSVPQKFPTMPWHTDFRLQQHNPKAD